MTVRAPHPTPATQATGVVPSSQDAGRPRHIDLVGNCLAGLALLGMLAAVVAIPLSGHLRQNDIRDYQSRVTTALVSDFGATPSPASRRDLPTRNADRSDPVTLEVADKHLLCSVETTTSASNLIVICAGAELPKLHAH